MGEERGREEREEKRKKKEKKTGVGFFQKLAFALLKTRSQAININTYPINTVLPHSH